MRAWIVTGLLLAATAFADDYPKPTGFVNDFANQLSASTMQALETKVHAYERATGNEIAVAIVPSLNGMLVDDYARGLFHAWGVGKSAVNNGVLFLWAPNERRIRIEVGTGLNGVLTDTASGLIVQRVRDLFRANRYADGVTAAVDGIIETLGTSPVGGTSPPAGPDFLQRNSPEELERQRQAEAQRQAEEDAASAASDRRTRIGWGVAAVLAVGLYLIYRRGRAARWQEELPRALADADQVLAEADRKRSQAQVALLDLRKEAPEEICQRFDVALGSAPDDLSRQRSDLERLRSLPRVTYGELKAAHNAVRHWSQRMATTETSFDEVSSTLDTFRAQRAEAQQMLDSLPSKLTQMEAEGVPGSSEGLLQAAATTYSQALKASQERPANWLLVHDLLADVSACLERIENPGMTQYRPARSWFGDMDSPAAEALALMWASQAAASSNDATFGGGSSGGGDSGGFFGGGGGDSGGFGGGDSGGGGASSDY